MIDNIFNTEQTEHHSNRQNAKIIYLQQQNAQLQDDIEDLQKSLKLNKEALQVSYQQQKLLQNQTSFVSNDKKGNNSTVLQSGNSKYQQNNQNFSVQIDKANQQLVEKLMGENKILLEQLEKLRKDRGMAHTKALIQEQISEENQNFQRAIVTEQDEKILELRRIIHDKEYAIQEFEKMHPQPLPNGTVLKVREIITPNEQSMKLHLEIENLRAMITKLTLENQNLNKKNQFLLDFNQSLKRELSKIRVVLSNPINFKKMKDENMSRDFVAEKKYQEDLARQQEILRQQQQGHHGNYQNNNYLLSRQQLFDRIDALEYTIENYRILFTREHYNNTLLQEDVTKLQKLNKYALDNNDTLVISNKQHQERVIQQHRELELYKSYYYKCMEFMKNRRKNNLSLANAPLNNIQDLINEHKQKAEQGKKKQQKSGNNKVNQNQQQQQNQKQPSQQNTKLDTQDQNKQQQIQQQQTDENNIEVNVSILDEDEEDNNNNNQLVSEQDLNGNIQLKESQNHHIPRDQQVQKKQPAKLLQDIESENHEMTLAQCKKYLYNIARELYIHLSNNNATKGITRQVLKRIQLGNSKPDQINLFKTKRSLSNPLDYTTPDFLKKCRNVSNENQNKDQQDQVFNLQQLDSELDLQQLTNKEYYHQQQYPQPSINNQNKGISLFQEEENDYQRNQYMQTQMCNYDYEEQKNIQKKMIVIQKNKGQKISEPQFQTQMNTEFQAPDNYRPVQTQMFKQKQQGPSTIRVNLGVPFNVDLDKIDVKQANHKKKITIHQFNDGDSFISNGEDFNF